MFALFTDKKQRAFEMLTKTRAIAILLCVVIFPAMPLAAQATAGQGRRTIRVEPRENVKNGLCSIRIDRPPGFTHLSRHDDLRHLEMAAVGARRGAEPPV